MSSRDAGGKPEVDGDVGARDCRARRLGEEPDQFGDLRRLYETRRRPLRIAAQQLVEVGRRIGTGRGLPAQHRRVDVARAHGVDAYSAWWQFESEGARQG